MIDPNIVSRGLNTLIAQLSARKPGETEVANTSYDGNNFVIKFPNAYESHEIIGRLLNNFMEAKLIDNVQLAQAQNHVVANGDKCNLNFEYNAREKSLNIIFKPKIEKNSLYEHLDDAIEKTKIGSMKEPATRSLSPVTTEKQIEKLLVTLNKILESSSESNPKVSKNYNTGFKEAKAGKDGEFIITYGADYNGKNSAESFLASINYENVISNSFESLAKNGIEAFNDNSRLEIQIKDKKLQITLKPKELEEFKELLNKAAIKVYNNRPFRLTKPIQQEKLIAQKIEQGIAARIPESAKPISAYLKEKTEYVFPGRNVKVTYTAGNETIGYSADNKETTKSDPLFIVNIDQKTGKDYKKLGDLISDLSRVFTENGVVSELKTIGTDRIGFCVNSKLHILLDNIKRNDKEIFAKSEQTSISL